jgi:uncharacterized membrane protein
MAVREKKQPTKVQAVFTGVLAVMLLANTAAAVLLEGRPATPFWWAILALDLALLGLSVWLYRRAAKNPPEGIDVERNP